MTFSYEERRLAVLEFAESVPELLLRHPSTAHLALQVSQLDLPSVIQSKFTVAIIGQMRAGKSTLLNALIGQNVAPVGVTETTATINWFRHGEGDQCGKFRVNWLDGTSEDRPLAQARDWLSRSENAQRTASIEFFCVSSFLKDRGSIVDTPGTRTTNIDERSKTEAFLAEKLERETLKHGGRAHAVIYAINPVAKQENVDQLARYIEQTRIPGFSAYNSIAVVQKWEHLRPDPIAEIDRMCERLRQQLGNKVSEVVRASGLLALAVLERDREDWDQVVELVSRSTPEAIATLSRSDRHFRSDVQGAALDVGTRGELLGRLGWPVLLFSLWITGARGLRSGAALRETLHKASGIDKLRETLHERFFARTDLILGFATLRKAWEPCRIGMLTFRNEIDRARTLQQQGRQALRLLEPQANGALAPVGAFVRESLKRLDKEIAHLDEAHGELDELFHREHRAFELLDADVRYLDQLAALDQPGAGLPAQDPVADKRPALDLSVDERRELQTLFGQHGPEARRRLSLSDDAPRGGAIDHANQRHGFWKERSARAHKPGKELFDHAVERLDSILNQLEVEA